VNQRARWLAAAVLLAGLPLAASAQCAPGVIFDPVKLRCYEPEPPRPVPDSHNPRWDAIAFSAGSHIAAWAGSFTLAGNANAAALKGCAKYAADCRIVSSTHDVCVAIAYEQRTGSPYRVAVGSSRGDAQERVLPLCMDKGPAVCQTLSRCSQTPPTLAVSGMR
jgi:Domain of unknown function (DUF4189)